MAALLTILRKLSLASVRDLAEIAGAACTCFCAPAWAPLVKGTPAAGHGNAADCKGREKQRDNGLPWPWPRISTALAAPFLATFGEHY
eukprot:8771921-Pyramimonas_sp.AAC.1